MMRGSKRNYRASRHVTKRAQLSQGQSHRQNAKAIISRPMRGKRCSRQVEMFTAPEIWHEPTGRETTKYIVQPAGEGFVHPATAEEVADRLAAIPKRFTDGLEVVQLSAMTRKRRLFPCYGMQWGVSLYLYPIEESLEEGYLRPPTPQQRIEAEMHGGQWVDEDGIWKLKWTEETIRDYYLNNILLHELGHHFDNRNTNFEDRERYANWFAIEFGLRATRG